MTKYLQVTLRKPDRRLKSKILLSKSPFKISVGILNGVSLQITRINVVFDRVSVMCSNELSWLLFLGCCKCVFNALSVNGKNNRIILFYQRPRMRALNILREIRRRIDSQQKSVCLKAPCKSLTTQFRLPFLHQIRGELEMKVHLEEKCIDSNYEPKVLKILD